MGVGDAGPFVEVVEGEDGVAAVDVEVAAAVVEAPQARPAAGILAGFVSAERGSVMATAIGSEECRDFESCCAADGRQPPR